MKSKKPFCSILTYLFALLSVVFVAQAVNVTVDDADPAWTYNSSLSWGQITPTHSCSFCLEQPDPALVNNHTWHDTDLANSATLTFLGISLTVYTICPGTTPQGYIYATNYTFTLDGQSDGSFHGMGCGDLVYDYPVYSRTGLAPTSHVFTIANHAPPASPSQPRSDLLLDYAVYDNGGLSTPTPSQAPSPSPSSASSSSSSSSSSSKSSSQRTQAHGIAAILGVVFALVAGVVVVGVKV